MLFYKIYQRIEASEESSCNSQERRDSSLDFVYSSMLCSYQGFLSFMFAAKVAQNDRDKWEKKKAGRNFELDEWAKFIQSCGPAYLMGKKRRIKIYHKIYEKSIL